MKNTTRILMALLAMILCLTTFVACNGGDDTTGTTTPATTTPATPTGGNEDPAPAPSAYINIIANDATEYQIVYGAGASDWEKAAAYEFQAAILTLTGIEIPVVSDFEDRDISRQSKEIVIGSTNRAPSAHWSTMPQSSATIRTTKRTNTCAWARFPLTRCAR